MKFSELKIGDEFETIKSRGIFTKKQLNKDIETDMANNAFLEFNGFSQFVFFDSDTEVTQINKKACSKCKWFHNFTYCEGTKETFCEKNQIYLNEKHANFETFHCSEFEREDKSK